MVIKERYDTVIRRFVQLAQERYSDHIVKIILYGSVARGEAGAESDIDLLVLWDGDEDDGWHELTGLAFDIMIEKGEYLSIKVVNARTFNPSLPFFRNIEKEGITVA